MAPTARHGVLRLALVWAGLAVGAGAVAIVVLDGQLNVDGLLFLFVGWSFIASGVVASSRRPDSAIGALMLAVGAMWFLGTLLKQWHASVPVTAGIWIGDTWLLPLAILLAAFPAGRLQTRAERVALIALAVDAVVLEALWLMFLNLERLGEGPGPPNALMVADEPGVADAIDVLQRVVLIASVLTLAFVLLGRYRRATGPLRRVLAPILAGAVALGLLAVVYVLDKFDVALHLLYSITLVLLTAVPLVFLAGLLRARLARSNVGELLVELREPAAPGALEEALAKALRDPSLELAYYVPKYRAYVDRAGAPVSVDGRVATFVERGGAQIAAILHDPALRDEPELVGAVASAAGIALENERLQADLRARLSELQASRARIVEAGETARRRLERDLHDGAQQRLVGLSVVLRVLAGRLATDTPEAQLLERARDELDESLEELRNLARGIHPAILSDHGLEVALESLAARSPIRIELDVRLAERPPLAVEVAAYYLVAEGVTNVAKYAEATRAAVRVRGNGALTVEVSDDGRGGADPGGGSGIRGLADRVEALGGRLTIESPPGGGTRLRAEIPCA